MLAITIFQVKTLRITKYQLINSIVQIIKKDLKPKCRRKKISSGSDKLPKISSYLKNLMESE